MSENTVMNAQTKDNLLIAMQRQAFVYAKYMLFAARARKNGRGDLAHLFEDIAKMERLEHFAQTAELAGLVGSDEENLEDAISGENYEVDIMYGDLAQLARNAGDQAVADLFGKMRRDARGHRDLYKTAAANLSRPTIQGGDNRGR